MLRTFAILLASFLLLSACETYRPLPEGYAGPRAYVLDTANRNDRSNSDIFFVSKFNGRKIEDSLEATTKGHTNRGLAALRPVTIGRTVPIQTATLTIVGRRHYRAPIFSLVGTVYEVSGDIEFTPAADQRYVVKGELGENYSAVWLEHEATGEIIGKKIEVHGSAALGLFEK